MASGTINTGRKAAASGYVRNLAVTASTSTAYGEICHSIGSAVRPQLNDGDCTFFSVVVNTTAPYYGIVYKASSKVIIGFLYYTGVTVATHIKFRDSSDDSAATYQSFTSNS